MDGREGQQLGNYRLLSFLGQGGFAEVYLGEHIHLGTKAAIKLHYKRVVEEKEIAAFKREAHTLARLRHPNIVRVLDFGVEASTPYLVMDYASGGTLRQRHPTGTRLPLPTVIEYVKQVAAALQYAHDQRLIHSDVKPENMLVGDNNEARLSDFGLAVILRSQHSSRNSKVDVGGTFRYMAPEVFKGRPRRASDQYSLGIVVYEWLCGTVPFNSALLGYQDEYESIPSLHSHDSTIPPTVEQVVLTALARQPEKRFDSVAAFATALERASYDTPMPPDSPAIFEPLPSVPSKPTILAVPSAQLMSSPSSIALHPAHEQSKTVTRRRMLLGARGLVGLVTVGVLGAGIWKFTHLSSSYQPPATRSQGTLYLTYRHSDAVEAIAWSHDGKRIASGSDDQTVQVWDAANSVHVFTYTGHSNAVRVVAWSPDSKRIASGSNDKTVQVWDPANSGNVFATYRKHSDAVTAVTWSPDGKYIASGGLDKTVQVWDAANGAHIFTYIGHSKAVTALAWSPDGKRIASGSVDQTVQVWDAPNGGHVFPYRGHASYVDAVAWSPDSKRIASGSVDQTVQVWDADNGAHVFTYPRHSNIVYVVAWSPDGKHIASGSYDRTVQVWNATNGDSAYIYPGHANAVLAIAWSPDSQRIASGGLDQTVQMWQA